VPEIAVPDNPKTGVNKACRYEPELNRTYQEMAAHYGVAVVPDPPLARALYGSVDIGQMIPEELFQGVAQLLAYVYRVAGQRAAVA